MNLNLKNKVAMVAASSKGLGYGIAEALAKEGALISIGSRNENNFENAAKKIRKKTGTHVFASELDSSNLKSISKWVEATSIEFGGVDKLVINAGGPPTGKFEDFSDSDWQDAFELNKQLENLL